VFNRALQGERRALGALLQQHTPELRRRLAGEIPARWQSVLAVDDILQETYTDAFLDLPRFGTGSRDAFMAWLWTLARRNLLDALKLLAAQKRGGARRAVAAGGEGDSGDLLLDILTASTSTPSRHAARKEAGAALQSALAHLPEHYRQVVQWYDFEGCTLQEIATRLNRSPATVCILRARALRNLQQALGIASDFLSGSR
jgi:RNA polymerase sigma-70 factor (subfamily 1)